MSAFVEDLETESHSYRGTERWRNRDKKKSNRTKMKMDGTGLRDTSKILREKSIAAQRSQREELEKFEEESEE